MPTTEQPGASAAEWAHFQRLGLTADLLPVVSDLTAVISPKSNLKALGKTPSQFNRNGQVVGIPDWTRKVSTDKDIDRWCSDQRLGICIKTGSAGGIFVLDLDVADKIAARNLRDYIFLITGVLPVRYRTNSGKCLLLFRMSGEFVKRVIHTAHGAIEFLATGQQFIACGTHPSGARYEWEGGLPDTIPELSPGEFAALWAGLQNKFGIEPERIARNGMAPTRVVREPNASIDPTANFLEANGWVKSWSPDGTVNIRCPFEDEHTSAKENESESATRYFPEGVGRKEDGALFQQGHFKCLHAHCAARSDGDFLFALGVVASEFEDLTLGTAVAADGTAIAVVDAAPPRYARNRQGLVIADIRNLTTALSRDDQCGMRIAWDTFRDEIVWASPGNAVDWRAFRDHDYVRLRIKLAQPLSEGGANFAEIGREIIRDAVHFVAQRNIMDSATLWAESLEWDGVERVAQFYSTYFDALDTPYTRAVALYTWSALAGRALEPGVQADMAIILKSDQGTGKTAGIRHMAPHPEAFGELDLHKPDDALARQTRGKMVCELSELRGLNSRQAETIKAWVSRRYEEWVPKFKEFSNKFPRRFICFGSTNEDQFLADSTGERRWLPLDVGRTDLEALERDRDQLWAEGVHLFRKHGVIWAEAETLAVAEHGRYKNDDPWSARIIEWLNEDKFGDMEGIRNGDFPVRTHEILQSAIGLALAALDRKSELRVASVLRRIGYVTNTVRVKGVPGRYWINEARLARAARLREAAACLG